MNLRSKIQNFDCKESSQDGVTFEEHPTRFLDEYKSFSFSPSSLFCIVSMKEKKKKNKEHLLSRIKDRETTMWSCQRKLKEIVASRWRAAANTTTRPLPLRLPLLGKIKITGWFIVQVLTVEKERKSFHCARDEEARPPPRKGTFLSFFPNG